MTTLNEYRLNDYIQHMLQAIERIEEYIEAHTEAYFFKDSHPARCCCEEPSHTFNVCVCCDLPLYWPSYLR